MKIRRGKKQDTISMDEIYVDAHIDESKLQFPKVSKKVMRDDMIKKQRSRRAKMKKSIINKKNYYLIAEEKGEIIGFGHAYIKSKDTGILESIYIKKQYRRKGIGKKIAKELIKWLKKKKFKYIESNALIKNKASLKLQEKMGFKPYFVRTRLK